MYFYFYRWVAAIKLLIILPLSGVRIKINYTKSSSEGCTFNKVQIKTRLLVLWSEQSLECCKTVVAGRAFESLSRNNCPQIKVMSSSNVHLHYIILHLLIYTVFSYNYKMISVVQGVRTMRPDFGLVFKKTCDNTIQWCAAVYLVFSSLNLFF